MEADSVDVRARWAQRDQIEGGSHLRKLLRRYTDGAPPLRLLATGLGWIDLSERRI